MAATNYELFFGTVNAGAAPAFARFARGDTHAPVTPPAITEIGNGLYTFSWDWGSSPSTTIEYVASVNGKDLSDVISAPATGPVIIPPSSSTYELFFGSANAGGAPIFARFARGDTHAALTPPAISEVGNGIYSFVWDWSASPASSIEYVATLNGAELADVLTAPSIPGAVTVTPQLLSLAGYQTAGTILNRVAVQVNLQPRTDPFDGVDPNFIQLVEFLATAGDDVLRADDWTHLTRELTFTADGSTQVYALPADYHEMLDQTEWNRSTRLPMVGPLSFQQSAMLKARLPNLVINVTFQILGNLLYLPIVPPTTSSCAANYISDYWLASSGATAPNKSIPSAKDDVCLFDPLLLVRAVKLKFLEAKGFDTTKAQEEYDLTLDHVIGKNTGAQVLSLDGIGRNRYERMIDGRNLPEGFWG